jgi:hypothetical protein
VGAGLYYFGSTPQLNKMKHDAAEVTDKAKDQVKETSKKVEEDVKQGVDSLKKK